jgi:hypothetical protein
MELLACTIPSGAVQATVVSPDVQSAGLQCVPAAHVVAIIVVRHHAITWVASVRAQEQHQLQQLMA